MLERNLLNDVLKNQLQRAQQRMKHFADKKRRLKEYVVGDKVYLKLQPYIQSSVAPRGNQKLSYRFFGPFTILARVGIVAYRLDLPEDSRIHPVVHVSQLKQQVPASAVVEDSLEQLPTDPTASVCPVKFSDSRLLTKGSSCLHQIQVQWSSMPAYLHTWEEVDDLRRRYPGSPAWGQAAFQGGAAVRSKARGTVCGPTTAVVSRG